MDAKIRLLKATADEKAAYRENPAACYPLYGFAVIGENTLLVEDLRLHKEHGAVPNYEVLAPRGMKFERRNTHTLFAYTMNDLLLKLSVYPLVDCDCFTCTNHD